MLRVSRQMRETNSSPTMSALLIFSFLMFLELFVLNQSHASSILFFKFSVDKQ